MRLHRRLGYVVVLSTLLANNLVAPGTPQAAAAVTMTDLSGPSRSGLIRSGLIRSFATLVFADDFNGSTLDPAKWGYCYPWSSPQGCTNASNHELQWYRPAAVSVGDGTLQINADRAVSTVIGDGKRFGYTSGLITTAGRFDMTYGYVEVRARIPSGQGLWPALWMLPVDESFPPEIDIMEAIGQRPYEAIVTYHRTRGDEPQAVVDVGDLSLDMHTYGLEWVPDGITWWIDGTEIFHVDAPVTDKPMYLLLNLAVGGSFPGKPDASTVFPASFVVDSVRAWTYGGL
jgi:beta-glucanase (GH16 family)